MAICCVSVCDYMCVSVFTVRYAGQRVQTEYIREPSPLENTTQTERAHENELTCNSKKHFRVYSKSKNKILKLIVFQLYSRINKCKLLSFVVIFDSNFFVMIRTDQSCENMSVSTICVMKIHF